MVNLTHEEKLLLYTYICREFPSVSKFQTFQTEEGLNKALLSFLEEIKDEPWKYLEEDFLEKIDKNRLVRILTDTIRRINEFYSYSLRQEILSLFENLLKYTKEKQENYSEKEEKEIDKLKDEKIKNILNKLNKLRAEGKIKI